MAIEAFKNSFYDVVTGALPPQATGQRVLIDALTEENPIFSGLPVMEANAETAHTFRRLVNVQGADVVNLDGALPTIGAKSSLGKVDLTPLGGECNIGIDEAALQGGIEMALASQLQPAIRETGNKIERSIFSDNFIAKAIEFGKAKTAVTNPDSSGSYPAIVAVTWTPGEMTGLYSPRLNTTSNFFEIHRPYGGFEHKNAAGVYEFSAYIKFLFGLMLENPKKISALVNLPALVSSPGAFALQLAGLVDNVNAGASTRIYCTRSVRSQIAVTFAQSTQGNGLISVDNDGNVRVLGVPVIVSANIPEKVGYFAGLPTA